MAHRTCGPSGLCGICTGLRIFTATPRDLDRVVKRRQNTHLYSEAAYHIGRAGLRAFRVFDSVLIVPSKRVHKVHRS